MSERRCTQKICTVLRSLFDAAGGSSFSNTIFWCEPAVLILPAVVMFAAEKTQISCILACGVAPSNGGSSQNVARIAVFEYAKSTDC